MGCSDSPPSLPPRVDCLFARRYRRSRDGDDGVSQVPGGPLRSCPALRPRWNRRALTFEDDRSSEGVAVAGGFRLLAGASFPSMVAVSPPRGALVLPSAKAKASASTLNKISGLNHTACSLAVYASQLSSPVTRSYGHARLASGWWSAFAARARSPAWVPGEVCAYVYITYSSPRLCLAPSF
jgi:hypothetical protein